ncbi:nucleotide-binding protein [Streptomyces sp. NPDC007205]|uniref:nucleotide-binding protein n=1 Tax=Streptomyces sp. NPDC007205 TaxID=3154316 RepID=UPI0033CDD327
MDLTEPSWGLDMTVNPKAVAVVHGRNQQATTAIFNFLSALGLEPQEWEYATAKQPGAAFTHEVVEKLFDDMQAVVVLMTPDDDAYLRDFLRKPSDPSYEAEPTGQPRQNVLLEAGMAFKAERGRTIIVHVGSLRAISDFAGLNEVRINGDSESISQALNKLALRLEHVGCATRRGERYTDPSGFRAALEQISDYDARTPDALNAPNARGETMAVTIEKMGLVDIEDRNDDAHLLPPSDFYTKAQFQVVISGPSLYRTLDSNSKMIHQLLGRGVHVYLLLLDPSSPDLPLVIAREEGHPVGEDIWNSIRIIENKFATSRGLHVGRMERMPGFTGVMIDGDIAPTGASPADSQSQIRVQPVLLYSTHHEGLVLTLKKMEHPCAYDFFASDLREQWKKSTKGLPQRTS